MQIYWQIMHAIFTIPIEELKLLNMIRTLQEGAEQLSVKMNDITFHSAFKMPAVHLSRRHKIYLIWLHFELTEIYGMGTFSCGKQHQVIKGMPVWFVQMGIMFFQVSGQPFNEQVLVNTFINGADVI